jgi:hypothetical protein
MKNAALCISLLLAFSLPAYAQNTNTNTVTNTVNVGAKPAAPSSHPVKPTPAKPSGTTATPAKPAVKKASLATASATGGASNVSVNSDANSNSSSNANGGAGGQGGTASASAGSVTVNNATSGKARKREAASAIAPSIYTSSECGKGASGAVQTGVFGLSLGGTSADVGCEARQNFNAFGAFNMPNAQATAMCMGDETQKAAIESEGVDCEVQTRGRVKNKALTASGFDLAAYCQEPVGDWERWADRAKVCNNVK